jgi:hypothetical protein
MGLLSQASDRGAVGIFECLVLTLEGQRTQHFVLSKQR